MNKEISVLYVEDEEEIRLSTTKVFEYFCDKVYVASDGKEGLELYKRYKPDIVVSDLTMPNMNGIEMAKAIKEIDDEQYIVFMTAYTQENYFLEAIELQVDGYILKPIDFDILKKKILQIKEQIINKEQIKQQQLLIQEVIRLQESLVVILDAQGKILFANDSFLKFFNVTTIEDFYKENENIEGLFLNEEEDDVFTYNINSQRSWLEIIEEIEPNKRIVSLHDKKEDLFKSFLISIKKVEDTQHTIVLLTEITHLRDEKIKLRDKAYTDELTSIYNRAYFRDAFAKELEKFKRNKVPFSLIFFDIDFFKSFNDTYGHQAGDRVLKELSQLIQKNIRLYDIFARWGGEEFVIILPHTKQEDAITLAEHLRKKVMQNTFLGNKELEVHCSFGVSEVQQNDTLEKLLKRVDDALYKAKRNGRNRVEFVV